MASLDEAYAKHDWALHHFSDLHHAFEKYLAASVSLGIGTKTPPVHLPPPAPGMTLHAAYKLSIKKDPPQSLSLILGDCIQNLRVSLDYLVYALALHALKGKKPHGTQFPISTDAGSYFKKGRHQVRVLHGMHRQVIRRIQPYQWGDRSTEHPLAILNRLSNQDKHRFLTVALLSLPAIIANVHAPPASGGRVIPSYLQESEEVRQMKLDPQVGVILPMQLNFEDGTDIFVTLARLGNLTRDILDWFRPIF